MSASDSAETSNTRYERQLATVRDELLAAQQRLQRSKSFALLVIVTGVPTAGRSEIVNDMLEWLDPKHIRVHAFDEEDAMQRPVMWPYWNALPPAGTMGFYFLGWYGDYLRSALHRPKKSRQHETRIIARICQLEAMLPKDRVRVLKLHLTVPETLQRERLAELRADKLTRWRVTKEEQWLVRHHDRVDRAYARIIEATGHAIGWHIVDGRDPRARALTAARLVLGELERRAEPKPKALPLRTKPSKAKPLRSQSSGRMDDDGYDRELEVLKGRFALLARRQRFKRHGAVFAFEGMDAAGKGGAIRRLTSALDARQYAVVPVSAPTAEEGFFPYLWRFWKNIPRRGEIAIFDRSWYGRVLVERVRDLTPREDWQRAYDEIREFELQLAEHGFIVHKFWLQVSEDEQLKRLQARDNDRLKRYKVDPEDWENRRFYDQYQLAAHEMIQRTDSEYAPCTVVEEDDNKYARLKVLRRVCEAVEKRLDE